MRQGRLFLKTVLYIDDNLDDLTLVKVALERAGVPICVQSYASGFAALRHLEQCALGRDQPLPDLVILDLKTSNPVDGEGMSTLARLRANKHLSHLAVYVLTGWENPVDRAIAKSLGVSGYIIKSTDFSELIDAVRTFFAAAPANPPGLVPATPVRQSSSNLNLL